MRVLYFSNDYTPHDHRFLAALAETEHQVYYLRLERSGMQREDRPLPPQIEQVVWRGGQGAFAWHDLPAVLANLRRVLHQIKPDVIHAGPVPKVAFLAALSGAHPLVSMSWGSDLLLEVPSNRWAERRARFALNRTDVLVGDCLAVKDKAVSLGFAPERVVLFPWGVDLKQFSPGSAEEFRARQGWQEAFVLLSLRAWEPLYGVDGVVRAFARAAEQAPQLRLLLLGGGSQAAALRQVIIQHGLLDKVYFGSQIKNSDLPQMYRAADVYVSASHSDGSSVSLMEALACGRPVLVSDIPGNREWVQPGVTGQLFADGNVEQLAGQILAMLRSPEELIQMGQRARTLAEQRADWPKNFGKLLEAYAQAVRLRGG